MKSLTHAVLPTAILVGLFSDSSLALTIPVILHPSQTSVHNSSSIPSAVASPTPTNSGSTTISPSISTVYLPQNTYAYSGPPAPAPVDIVPPWSLSPSYLAQLVKTGKFSDFFKNLYSRDASPEDVKIIDTKGPQDVKIIDTKGPQDVKIIDTKGPQDVKIIDTKGPRTTPTPTVSGYNLDDILIIDRKGPNPIPNATPPPVPPPGFTIDDFLIIDRKGSNPAKNPKAPSNPSSNPSPNSITKRSRLADLLLDIKKTTQAQNNLLTEILNSPFPKIDESDQPPPL